MTGGELTLGAVPARLEEREREITAQAETMREQITRLTAQLDELGRAAEDVRITRKTLLGLPDPAGADKSSGQVTVLIAGLRLCRSSPSMSSPAGGMKAS
ncbi:hypothetical protein [Streptomyces sp. NBC_01477]|uniref:hypothetical protein n=1 Tax=Streptomyces sp. NBC_01477 TaxID=2976015 RepID=UPI002E3677DB|nr:hypothetical protein [Streptomyces sp. NBC_01477]